MAANTQYATKRKRANFSGRGVENRVSLIATGLAANTDMTVTGIRPGKDYIASVITHPTGAVGVPADDTANVTITAANTIRSTTNNTGRALIVAWIKS
jgi:hypothetical protein